MFRGLAPVLAASALIGHVSAAPWIRIQSPNFELLTDAGEKQGRPVLDRLETVRRVFLESIGGRPPALPVRVFLFGSERDFRRFEPRQTVRGFHQGSAGRDYIAVLASGEETLRVARHEFMHLLLSHGVASLPLWLEEGTAELYSTVELRGSGAVFGSPIVNHVRALKAMDWIRGDLFFAAAKDSPLLDHASYAGIFYAQAWALTHMLNFSPAWRRNMPRFVELIDQGTPALLAFEPAFGYSPARALAELRNYVGDSRFATALVPMPPAPVEAANAAAEPLTEAGAALAQVELMLAVGRPESAAKLLAAVTGPPTAELETARGLGALARRQTAAAKEHFLAAIGLGGGSAVAAFEYAMLLRDEHAPAVDVLRYLTEAVGRNPDLAEAQFILGLMAQREKRHEDALGFFGQALRVLPRQSYFWHARAMSHVELKQPELARRAALRAAASATTDAQLEMAQKAMALVKADPAPPPAAPKPAVFVPDSWRPRQGGASVAGVLEQIDCHGASARFQIRPSAAAAPVQLWVDNPGEVLLKDASSLTFTFTCGPQQPRKVIVEYDALPGLPQGSTGRITAIHF